MKVQYFGDKHDFRKYVLLRLLAKNGFKIGVCWMMTGDDLRSDGDLRAYLNNDTQGISSFDGELYKLLSDKVSKSRLQQRELAKPTRADLELLESDGLIENAVYYNCYLDEKPSSEVIQELSIRRYFENAAQCLKDADIVFFDPDNGLEVLSCRITRTRAAKYLYYREAKKFYESGKSLVIYQHFRFIKKDVFIPDIIEELSEILGGVTVKAFETPNVIFLVAVQPDHEQAFNSIYEDVAKKWPRQKNFVWIPECLKA